VGGKEREQKGLLPDENYDLGFSEMDEDITERERRGNVTSAGKGGRDIEGQRGVWQCEIDNKFNLPFSR
jgi:hypothetical protein